MNEYIHDVLNEYCVLQVVCLYPPICCRPKGGKVLEHCHHHGENKTNRTW